MKKEFKPLISIFDLKDGDIVRGKMSKDVFIVTACYGTRVTAVRSQDITHAEEWEVLRLMSKRNSNHSPQNNNATDFR